MSTNIVPFSALTLLVDTRPVKKPVSFIARDSLHVPFTARGTFPEKLLLFWHVPLEVRSAICRHQRPQRMVLSQVDYFVQCEVVGSQVSLYGVQPRDTGMPWRSEKPEEENQQVKPGDPKTGH